MLLRSAVSMAPTLMPVLVFLPESRTQEALKSGHFVDVLSILLRLQRICNHPGLVEPRLPESSYTAGPLRYRSASLVLQALDGDSRKVCVRSTPTAGALCAALGLGGCFRRARPALGTRLPLMHGLRPGSAREGRARGLTAAEEGLLAPRALLGRLQGTQGTTTGARWGCTLASPRRAPVTRRLTPRVGPVPACVCLREPGVLRVPPTARAGWGALG